MIEFLLGFLVSIPLWAVIEYAWHRFLMHSSLGGQSFRDHTLHHGGIVWSEPSEAWKFPSNGVSPILNMLGSAPLWIPVAMYSSSAAYGMGLAALLHGVLWTAIHHEYHRTEGVAPSWTRWRIVQYIFANHRAHHRSGGKTRFAALLPPFMDVLFGTR